KICTSETIPIAYDASGFAFVPNNNFVVQLSSDTTFTVKTSLWSITSNAPTGTADALVPSNITSGTYFIRIAAFTPPSIIPTMTTPFERVTINALPTTQSITSTGGASVCKDVAANFSSNLTGTGFQWYKNNVAVGTDSPNYSDNGLASGDI